MLYLGTEFKKRIKREQVYFVHTVWVQGKQLATIMSTKQLTSSGVTEEKCTQSTVFL